MARRLAFLLILQFVVNTSAVSDPQGSTDDLLKYIEAKTISLKHEFQTRRDWHVTAYIPQGDNAETGDLPIKICFWFAPTRDQACTTIGSKEYPHQNLRELSVVSLLQSSPPLLGVLVDTFFSGGGSGIAREVSILTYDRESDVFSDVASMKLNEISDFRIFSGGILGGSIVTASGLWQQNEGHFGDHRFWVQVCKYSNYYGRYEKLIGYLTVGKYPSEEIRVIEKETGIISELIRNTYGSNDPLGERSP
jgi:hypothetical protein